MASRSSAKRSSISYTSRFVILEQLREIPLSQLIDELVVEEGKGRRKNALRSDPLVYRFSETAPGFDCKLLAYPQPQKFDNKKYLVPSFNIECKSVSGDAANDFSYFMRVGLVRTAGTMTGGSFHVYNGMILFPLVAPASKPTHFYPPSEHECVLISSIIHAGKPVLAPEAAAAAVEVVASSTPADDDKEKKKKKRKKVEGAVSMTQIWSPQNGATIAVQVLAIAKLPDGTPCYEEEHSTVWDHRDVIRTMCFTHEREPSLKKNKKAKEEGVEEEQSSSDEALNEQAEQKRKNYVKASMKKDELMEAMLSLLDAAESKKKVIEEEK
jgi:hypothetical protein